MADTGPLRGMGCACQRGPRASRGGQLDPRPGPPGQTYCRPDPPFLFPEQSFLESPVSGPLVSLCRVFPSFSSALYPECTCSPEAPAPSLSASSLCLQSPTPGPSQLSQTWFPLPRLPTQMGWLCAPPHNSTWHSHPPGAGVTLQVDALPQKTSTPRLSLLVDTPPTSLHPGCACTCVHCRTSQAWRGGRDRPESQGLPWGKRSCSEGLPTGRSRARTRALTTRTADAPGRRGCGRGRGSLRGLRREVEAPPALEGAVEMMAAWGRLPVGSCQRAEQASFSPAVSWELGH